MTSLVFSSTPTYKTTLIFIVSHLTLTFYPSFKYSMAGRKRASDSEAVPSTRGSKAAKTDTSSSPAKTKGSKKGPKATIPTSTFKARALPLHINITHTPPSIVDETVEAGVSAPIDPGFIGAVALAPTTFSTGSYGWKGSKRIVVELLNAEAAEGEPRDKVHVLLTMNATVVGSKQAKEEGDTKEEEETKEAEVEAADGHEEADPVTVTASEPTQAAGEE